MGINLLICILLGISLPFLAGIALMKQRNVTALVLINAGAFFAVAVVSIASKLNGA